MSELNTELKQAGLRKASLLESGYYYVTMIDGERVSAWVTEVGNES